MTDSSTSALECRALPASRPPSPGRSAAPWPGGLFLMALWLLGLPIGALAQNVPLQTPPPPPATPPLPPIVAPADTPTVPVPDSLRNQLTVTPVARRDTSYWVQAFKSGLNITQASFTDNWQAGGTNSLAYTAMLQYRADYVKHRTNLRHETDLQYGAARTAPLPFRKSLDRIFVDNNISYAISRSRGWSVFASVNFLSQFDDGFRFERRRDSVGQEREVAMLVSRFLAPGFLTQSIGLQYKPVDYFFVRIGTGTLRQTFLRDTTLYRAVPENYGVPRGLQVRNEVAFQLMANFEKDIISNVNFKARYIGFINYGFITQFKHWDHRIETTLIARVNKYISSTIGVIALYDLDATDKWQYSQTLTFGLVYAVGKMI